MRRAIRMQVPDYVPILFFNKDKEQSDIIMIDVVRHFGGPNADLSEWGFRWERKDDTMGQPEAELIQEWSDFEKLTRPDPFDVSRFDSVAPTMQHYGDDRYYLASLVLTGFTVMTFLRGFANTMEDFYEEPEHVARLADAVFQFEEGIVSQLARQGFHGVAFFDDWGTQESLLVSPTLWREFFKPRYQRIFDQAHAAGLDVYFHSCGFIREILPDFVEIGVDMMNVSQPNLFDIEQLGKDLGGKVCFVCPVSYQTTAISGSKDDIYRDVQRLVDHLGCFRGGLIGYVEEYHSIGLSSENYRHCVKAFQEIGRYQHSGPSVLGDA